MAEFDPQSEVVRFQAQAQALERLFDVEKLPLAKRSALSGWSALEHAAHATLANELVLRNLRNLLKGEGMLVVYEAEQNAQALELLARGDLLRGRAQSPRMVRPPSDLERATVHAWAAAFTHDLTDFARAFAPPARRAFVPHQLLGALDFAQWARFGAVHTQHHVQIAREVLQSCGADAADLPPASAL